MGAFTSGFVTFHACPPHQVRRVFELLDEYGFLDPDDRPSRLVVALGAKYSGDERWRAGDITRLAIELVDEAPEVVFTAYEEPYKDQLGTTCWYVPGLGMYSADCDRDGAPVLRRPDVLKWMTIPAQERDTKLGVPWETAIAALPEGSVEEPDSFAAQWNRRTNHVQVVDGRTDGGDLSFTAAGGREVVDAALADRGFQRATTWIPLNDDQALWRTDVYKSPANRPPTD